MDPGMFCHSTQKDEVSDLNTSRGFGREIRSQADVMLNLVAL
jgi:hypothetical protein